jgi:uncharacterized membrane protein YdcZ (DUF606 family)
MSIDSPMVLHDARISTFREWWKRGQRSGFAYSQLVHIHGGSGNEEWSKQLRSIAFWGGALPSLALFGSLSTALYLTHSEPVILLLIGSAIILYIIQAFRILLEERRRGTSLKLSAAYSLFLLVGKFAQFNGALKYCWRVITGTRQRVFDYKKDRSEGRAVVADADHLNSSSHPNSPGDY